MSDSKIEATLETTMEGKKVSISNPLSIIALETVTRLYVSQGGSFPMMVDEGTGLVNESGGIVSEKDTQIFMDLVYQVYDFLESKANDV